MYATLLAVPVVLLPPSRGGRRRTPGSRWPMLSVAMVAVAPLGGRLADRRGHRIPAVAGLALLALATAGLATMADAPSAAGLAAALLVAGVGLGLANAPLQAAAVEAVDPRDAGVASGLYSSGRYTGSILSSALLAVLLGHGTDHAGALFAVTTVTALLAAALALRLDSPDPVPVAIAGVARP